MSPIDYTQRTDYTADVPRMKAAHKLVSETSYAPGLPQRGYNDRTLHIDLTTAKATEKKVTQQMKDLFVGGRGFGLYYLWQATKPETKWNDPENDIVIAPGPLAGNTLYPGSGKSIVVTISPATDIPIDSNVGGYYGPLLKFSGFDAIELQGKAERDVVVVVDGVKGTIRIEEAPEEPLDSHVLAEILTHMYAEGPEDLANVSVVSAGRGSDHSYFGCLNFSLYDKRRKAVRLKQAGRGGIGRVFRDKKVKALVVRGPKPKGDMNNMADRSKVAKVGLTINKEILDMDAQQCRMRTAGTAHLVEIMDAYDLLPVNNYQFGKSEAMSKIESKVWEARFTQGIPDGCWIGCTMACAKGADGFVVKTGPYKGHTVTVDGPEYENVGGLGSNCGIFDPDWILESNFYCDTYGLDTISFGTHCAFLMECYERGILNKERTGGIELKFGSGEAQMELMHRIAEGEGFGAVAAKGIKYCKGYFIERGWGDPQLIQDIGMECKGLEYSEYISKESLAQQGGYALTNKGPQHDEAWLIFMDMVNKQLPTFEAKAEALHYFPIFRTWFGLHGLCKLPWNDIEPADNGQTAEPAKVPEHVYNYTQIYEGIVGKPITKEELILQSERVYNFQRAFNVRRGYGLRKNDLPPYRSVGPVTKEEYESRAERYDGQLKELVGFDPAGKSTEEKIAALRAYREKQYQLLCDAVYKRRGWTSDGVPTAAKLKELGMDLPEVVEVVRAHGA